MKAILFVDIGFAMGDDCLPLSIAISNSLACLCKSNTSLVFFSKQMSSEKFEKHTFTYYHAGSWWDIEICADSKEDAETRIKKLPNAQYVGVMDVGIPATLGFLAKWICGFRNWMNGE